MLNKDIRKEFSTLINRFMEKDGEHYHQFIIKIKKIHNKNNKIKKTLIQILNQYLIKSNSIKKINLK